MKSSGVPVTERPRVLVTGGTGFIGRHLWKFLLEKKFQVVLVVGENEKIEGIPSGFKTIKGDLLNLQFQEHLLEEAQATHLLHFAWFVKHGEFWEAPENEMWWKRSRELFRKFVQSGGKRIVAAGTCAEYSWENFCCSEERTPLSPKTLYGQCKKGLQLDLENLGREAGISWAWGRIFLTFGPGENSSRLVPLLCRHALSPESASVPINENQIRDFLGVENLADAFVSVLAGDREGCFNCASGIPYRLGDLKNFLNSQAQSFSLNLEIKKPSVIEGDALYADVTRLQTWGWKPRNTLEQSLSEYLLSMRKALSWPT